MQMMAHAQLLRLVLGAVLDLSASRDAIVLAEQRHIPAIGRNATDRFP